MHCTQPRFGSNSFDIIRLIAALSVVWGHAIVHLSISEPVTVTTIHSIINMFPGVVVLFGISGYLISASLDNSMRKYTRSLGIKNYLRSRFLRIYPALWLALLVSIISIALLDGLPRAGEFVPWLIAQLTVFQFYTSEFFRGFGVGTPNGSLWTISVEIQFYIVIMCIYPILRRANARFWVAMMVLGGGISIANDYAAGFLPEIISKLVGVSILPYLYMFLIGSCMYFLRNKVLMYAKYTIFTIIPYVMVRFLLKSGNILLPGTYVDVMVGTYVPVITIGLAYSFGRHRLPFDISYGVYIYHMVVINVFVELGLTSSYTDFALVLVITIGLAFCSWNIVEKPCLALKRTTLSDDKTVG